MKKSLGLKGTMKPGMMIAKMNDMKAKGESPKKVMAKKMAKKVTKMVKKMPAMKAKKVAVKGLI